MPSVELVTKEIRAKIDRLRRVIRTQLMGEGVSWLIIAAVGLLLAAMLIDFSLYKITRELSPRLLRALVLVSAAAVLAWVLWRRLLRRVAAPLERDDLVLLVEQRYPQLADRLIGAVQFASRDWQADPSASPAMVMRMAEQANDMARPLDFLRPVDRSRLGRFIVGAVAAVGLLALLTVSARGTMIPLLQRNLLLMDVALPQDTYLDLAGRAETVVVRGDPLTVVVSAERRSRVVPEQVTLHVQFDDGERSSFNAEAQSAEDGGTNYVFEFSSVSAGMEFFAVGHDDRTQTHHVRVVDPPEMRRVDFRLEYPGYMNRSASRIEDARGTLSAPAGAWIDVVGATTKEVSAARLLLDGEPICTLRVGAVDFAEPGQSGLLGRFQLPAFEGEFAPTARLEFELTDDYRTHRGAGSFHLQYEIDQPPQVQVIWQMPGETISPIAMIPVDVVARDHYGLASLDSMIQILPRDDEPVAIPVEALPDRVRVISLEGPIRHRIDLQPLGLDLDDEAVQTARLWMRVGDTLPAPEGPTLRDSEARELKIVSESELMAEQLRQQKQERLQMDQTISSQQLAIDLTAGAIEQVGEGNSGRVTQLLNESLARQREVAVFAEDIELTYQTLLVRHVCNRLQESDEAEAAEEARANMRRIIESLDGVVTGDMRLLQVALEAARDPAAGATLEELQAIHAGQQAVLAQLEAVREMMVRYEGLQELAVLLNQIIDRASEIKEALEAGRRHEAGELFDD